MILTANVTQQEAFFFVQMRLTHAPSDVTLRYDSSTEEEDSDDYVPDWVEISPSWEYSGGLLTFSDFVLTNKGFTVTVDDTSWFFDEATEAYEFAFNSGEDSDGLYLALPDSVITDFLKVELLLPLGDNIAYSDDAQFPYNYQVRPVRVSGINGRVYLRGLPELPSGRFIIKADGIVDINRTRRNLSGYSIFNAGS